MFVHRLSSRAAGAVRLWNGEPARRSTPAPTPELILFEYEASPWCRRVRETLGVLGLAALIKPCPRETLRAEGAFGATSRHRPEAAAAAAEAGASSRLSFPLLVDRTAGVTLSDSAAICEHLWSLYGGGVERPTLDQALNPRRRTLLDFPLLAAPSALRPWPEAGLMLAPSEPNQQPLLLYGCEADAGSRLVREALCSLQLEYRSQPRPLSAPLPALEDPNSGFAAFGARQALEHLDRTHRTGEALGWLAPLPSPNLGEARMHPVLARLLGR
ncbi:hypothetical protein EMIHUDRAFT_368077 [Emiliania huxleyi CCMP1516]|uniref:GST N-terminal domain-containing protein n=2 Tax=Emiliania huxleyi TaxID=2903 RepID=A0A0D3JIZ8_EMIH1|nr:hypothetical protein EMIHUDRAFT_368077 [Emiliania huxleyi CCMP1516]EOD23483.1 hypothetical protein EMIHUDRAFT_368077 [Emiliania huxleyi CCMP1516]|eukprot:XP_005775912.1 hypothetical protein EMIHUDRAFT_368077 [Emiliania huxleyi CCMP1516]